MLRLALLLTRFILKRTNCHTKMNFSLRTQNSGKIYYGLQPPIEVFVMFAGFTQILVSIAFFLFSRLIDQDELRDKIFFLCLPIICEISYRLSLSLEKETIGRILGLITACIFVFLSFFFWNGLYKITTMYSFTGIIGFGFLVYAVYAYTASNQRLGTPISALISAPITPISIGAVLIVALGSYGLILTPKTVGGELWRFGNQPATIIILFASILMIFLGR